MIGNTSSGISYQLERYVYIICASGILIPIKLSEWKIEISFFFIVKLRSACQFLGYRLLYKVDLDIAVVSFISSSMESPKLENYLLKGHHLYSGT